MEILIIVAGIIFIFILLPKIKKKIKNAFKKTK